MRRNILSQRVVVPIFLYKLLTFVFLRSVIRTRPFLVIFIIRIRVTDLSKVRLASIACG